jgi:hypothetical protein
VISSVSSAAAENGWIYYIKHDGDDPKSGAIYRLYRSNSDGSESMKVSDDKTANFIVSGSWIYYSEYNGCGIYKIRVDGTNKTKISNCTGMLKAVYDNYLYLFYASESDQDISDACGYIYKMNQNGTALEKICTDPVLGFQVSKSYIFYSNYNDNYTLYKINTDGTERTKLTSDSTGDTFSIAGNMIYYIKHEDGFEDAGEICKMNLDGTGRTDIGITGQFHIKVSEGLIYYMSENGDFFKANLDGTAKTEIAHQSLEIIKVFGESYM